MHFSIKASCPACGNDDFFWCLAHHEDNEVDYDKYTAICRACGHRAYLQVTKADNLLVVQVIPSNS